MISARSELGSSRMPPAGGGERGQLVQEQRVATAALEQRGQQLRVGALIGEQLRGELLGVELAEWLQVQRHHGGALGVRRPHHFAARTHRGDQHERQAAERCDEVLEQVDHHRSAQCRSSIHSTTGRSCERAR